MAEAAQKLIAVGTVNNTEYYNEANEHQYRCVSPDASLAIFDVSKNPLQPSLETCYSNVDAHIGYVHDAQCVSYNGPSVDYQGVNVCILFASPNIHIFNLDTLEVINTFTYEHVGYTHQGWLSDDHTTLYVSDELDEILRTTDDTTTATTATTPYSRTVIFDISNLDEEPVESVFTANQTHSSIDHNLYIKEDRMYNANYNAGARIRQIHPDGTLEEIAYFDTEHTCECVPDYATLTGQASSESPSCTCDPFMGVWTHYPYYSNSISTASDIYTGLFVLRTTI